MEVKTSKTTKKKKLGKLYLWNTNGTTTLNEIRAETSLELYLGEVNNAENNSLDYKLINVVRSHSGATNVVVQVVKRIINTLNMERYNKLIQWIRLGKGEVVKAKKSRGHAT